MLIIRWPKLRFTDDYEKPNKDDMKPAARRDVMLNYLMEWLSETNYWGCPGCHFFGLCGNCWQIFWEKLLLIQFWVHDRQDGYSHPHTDGIIFEHIYQSFFFFYSTAEAKTPSDTDFVILILKWLTIPKVEPLKLQSIWIKQNNSSIVAQRLALLFPRAQSCLYFICCFVFVGFHMVLPFTLDTRWLYFLCYPLNGNKWINAWMKNA